MISHHLREVIANGTKPAPTFVSSSIVGFSIGEGGTATDVLTAPSGATQGDLLILLTVATGTPGLISNYGPSDAGWTSISGGNYYKYAGASEPSAYSFSSSWQGGNTEGAIVRAVILRIRGGTLTVAGTSKSNLGVGSTVSTNAITLPDANSLVVAFFNSSSEVDQVSFTVPSGFTQRHSVAGNVYRSVNVSTKVFTTTGSTGSVSSSFTPADKLCYGILFGVSPT